MLSFLNNRDPDERARELLSAYIDGQCTPSEKALVEARLAHSVELRAELDELRATIQALRQMPAVPLPRSFYLTPSMVGERRPVASPFAPIVRALQIASGVVGALLVIVVFGAIVQGMSFGMPVATSLPAAAPAGATPAASGGAAGSSQVAVTAAPMVVPNAAAPMQTQATSRSSAEGSTGATNITPVVGTGAPPASLRPTTGTASGAPPVSEQNRIAATPGTTSGASTLSSTLTPQQQAQGQPNDAASQSSGATPQREAAANQDSDLTKSNQRQPSLVEQIRAGGLWSLAGGLFILLIILLALRALLARRT